MNEIEILEQRLAELEEKQAVLGDELEKVQQLANQLRRKQIKEGSLALLLDALRYHHKMNNGWTRLTQSHELDEFPAYQELHTEFIRMREVVIHYEYVAQVLLGINPSPGAGFGEEES